MCGRYVVAYFPDDFSERYQLRVIPETLFQSFNAAPTQTLPVVVERPETGRELAALRWGLVPRWSKPGEAKPVAPFNARAESVASKPMFRNLFKKKRCLVPVNGYYEWKTVGGKKQPYLFTVPDEPMFSLAGLYDDTGGEDERAPWGSYAVITTEANEFTGEFHSRMPVIIAREDEEEWLSPEETDIEPLERLLRPYPAEAMAARRVSAAVNNVRNNQESLIEPQDDDEPLVPGALF